MIFCRFEQERFANDEFSTRDGVQIHNRKPIHTSLGIVVETGIHGAFKKKVPSTTSSLKKTRARKK